MGFGFFIVKMLFECIGVKIEVLNYLGVVFYNGDCLGGGVVVEIKWF